MSRSTRPAPPEPISDRNYVLRFGRYRGDTLQDVLDNDPFYIVWLSDNTDMDFSWDILEEAQQGPRHTFTGFSSRNDPR